MGFSILFVMHHNPMYHALALVVALLLAFADALPVQVIPPAYLSFREWNHYCIVVPDWTAASRLGPLLSFSTTQLQPAPIGETREWYKGNVTQPPAGASVDFLPLAESINFEVVHPSDTQPNVWSDALRRWPHGVMHHIGFKVTGSTDTMIDTLQSCGFAVLQQGIGWWGCYNYVDAPTLGTVIEVQGSSCTLLSQSTLAVAKNATTMASTAKDRVSNAGVQTEGQLFHMDHSVKNAVVEADVVTDVHDINVSGIVNATKSWSHVAFLVENFTAATQTLSNITQSRLPTPVVSLDEWLWYRGSLSCARVRYVLIPAGPLGSMNNSSFIEVVSPIDDAPSFWKECLTDFGNHMHHTGVTVTGSLDPYVDEFTKAGLPLVQMHKPANKDFCLAYFDGRQIVGFVLEVKADSCSCPPLTL